MQTFNVTEETKEIFLGRQGENLATQVVFEIPSDLLEYAVFVYVLRNGESDAYPASVVDVTDGVITWTITSIETEYYGAGEAQIRFVDDETIVKTIVFRTIVKRSIDMDVGDVPDPYETWVDSLTQIAAEAQQSANDAEQYADLAAQHAESSGYAYFEVDNESGEMYVTVTDGVDDNIHFDIDEETGILEVTLV